MEAEPEKGKTKIHNLSIGNSPTRKPESNSNHSIRQPELYETLGERRAGISTFHPEGVLVYWKDGFRAISMITLLPELPELVEK